VCLGLLVKCQSCAAAACFPPFLALLYVKQNTHLLRLCNISAAAPAGTAAADVREQMLLVLKRGLEHNRCAAAACMRIPLMCNLAPLHAALSC
jgi:hypothetical protein